MQIKYFYILLAFNIALINNILIEFLNTFKSLELILSFKYYNLEDN
jgi:UDP-N-acetylmuramyl pentapeptide synthase